MRVLIISALLSMLPGSPALGQEVFGDWMIFPGPNPDAKDLLPEADSENLFRIGQIIFENQAGGVLTTDKPVKNLSDLPPVAEVVKSSEASPSLVELIDQQLTVPHRFVFEQAMVADYGDTGLVWHVSYALFPKEGGFSGVPFRYRTVAEARGKIIPPELTLFDAFFHSAKLGWSCSTLRLSAPPPRNHTKLTEEVIRDRATKQLQTLFGSLPDGVQHALRKRVQYRNQEQVRIPFATDSKGGIVYFDLWAVNFVDSARKERPNEVFSVWISADGSVARLRHLDIELNDDLHSVAHGHRTERKEMHAAGHSIAKSDRALILDAVLLDVLTNPDLEESREFYGASNDQRVALVTNQNYGVPWPSDYHPVLKGWNVDRVDEAAKRDDRKPPLLGVRIDKYSIEEESRPNIGLLDSPIVISILNVGGLKNGVIVQGACGVYYRPQFADGKWSVECEGFLDP